MECCSTASVCLLEDGKLYGWGTGDILKDTLLVKQQVRSGAMPSLTQLIKEIQIEQILEQTSLLWPASDVPAPLLDSSNHRSNIKSEENYIGC